MRINKMSWRQGSQEGAGYNCGRKAGLGQAETNTMEPGGF